MGAHMSDRFIGRTKDAAGISCELFEPSDTNIEVHVDGIQGLSVHGSVVKFNFFRTIPDHFGKEDDERLEGVQKRLVAARIVMGVDTFLSVTQWLGDNAADMLKQIKANPISAQSLSSKEH